MPRTHRPYPPEFRAEAVRLARGSDKPIPALAADLGVSSEALRHWLRRAEADDARARRVVGWAMADHLRTALALTALAMALARRRPSGGLVQHPDRGCQSTAGA
jgi:transposase-like protein